MSKPRDPDNELKIEWSKKENDFMVYYPSKRDGGFLLYALKDKKYTSRFVSEADREGKEKIAIMEWNKNLCITEEDGLLAELDKRGYDLTTLKISIKKKIEP